MTTDADKKLIAELLTGRVTRDKCGLPRTVYLKPGSDEEKKARRALVRYLKTTLPPELDVKFVIAELIDPEDDGPRQIRFEHRRKGKPSNPSAENTIAEFIWAQRRAGVKKKEAVHRAKEKFGLKEKRVSAIWKRWRPILERSKRRDLDGNPVVTPPFTAIRHNRD